MFTSLQCAHGSYEVRGKTQNTLREHYTGARQWCRAGRTAQTPATPHLGLLEAQLRIQTLAGLPGGCGGGRAATLFVERRLQSRLASLWCCGGQCVLPCPQCAAGGEVLVRNNDLGVFAARSRDIAQLAHA